MKNRMTTAIGKAGMLAAGVVALTLSSGALLAAQHEAGEGSQPLQELNQPQQATGREDIGAPWSSGELIGRDVKNIQGESLGTLSELFIGGDGRVQYVVVAFGGLLGMGDKVAAIPWEAFQIASAQGDAVVVELGKDRLTNAPAFAQDRWSEMQPTEWMAEVNDYYGVSMQVPFSQQAAAEPDPQEEKLQMEELAVDGELASFEELDADSDGIITRSEAQDSKVLDQRFGEADNDGNGQLDRTEFSAFEERMGQQGEAQSGAQRPLGSPAEEQQGGPTGE